MIPWYIHLLKQIKNQSNEKILKQCMKGQLDKYIPCVIGMKICSTRAAYDLHLLLCVSAGVLSMHTSKFHCRTAKKKKDRKPTNKKKNQQPVTLT